MESAPNPTNIQIDYSSQIGYGYISKVYLGVDRLSRQKYAVKIIDLSKCQKQEIEAIRREVQIQHQIRHQNIIRLFGSKRSQNELHIFLEYAEKGNLFDFLKKKNPSGKELLKIYGQIVLAVGYLHSKGVLHRDIKPENILFNSHMQPKLCDFGFSA